MYGEGSSTSVPWGKHRRFTRVESPGLENGFPEVLRASVVHRGEWSSCPGLVVVAEQGVRHRVVPRPVGTTPSLTVMGLLQPTGSSEESAHRVVVGASMPLDPVFAGLNEGPFGKEPKRRPSDALAASGRCDAQIEDGGWVLQIHHRE